MIRLCNICNEEKETPYKDICRKCYQNKWLKTITEKICEKCRGKFTLPGKICHPCYQNKKNEDSRVHPCSQCNRRGLIIARHASKICITCHRKNIELKDPEFKEKRRKQIRESGRRKRGNFSTDPAKTSKGFWKTPQGYIMIYKPNHGNANVNGCVQEHVFVMSEHIGRPLKDKENVHHRNGIRDDNRIDNLELWYRSQCPGQRLDEKIQWAKEFLEEYGYKIT